MRRRPLRQCLGQGVAAPDLITVKDFLMLYIAISNPRLDVRKRGRPPTLFNTVAEWFFTGFTRVPGTDIVEEERSKVCNVRPSLLSVLTFTGPRGLISLQWVRRSLTLEGIVVN